MALPLTGRTIALAEGRQLEELTAMLGREGATILPCPMVSILDVPDPGPVLAWLQELVADHFSWVLLLTGEGLRRLLAFAGREGSREAVLAALGRAQLLCRGPKPVRALKEVGLVPTEVTHPPTTEGVIATLRRHDLRGQTVGVQLYNDSNPPLTEFLTSTGAVVRTVLPYVYAPQSDGAQVACLIERLAQGEVDVLVFTSSPQVDRLYDVARERGLEETLHQGLQRTCVAAVGPVVADNLSRRGTKVDVCPEQGWVMKNLVRALVKLVPQR